MSLKCNNIEALRLSIKNGCEEEKAIQKQIEDLVKSINNLDITTCNKK